MSNHFSCAFSQLIALNGIKPHETSPATGGPLGITLLPNIFLFEVLDQVQ